MSVVDSSYLVDTIISRHDLLAGESVIIPDLAVYEVANAIFKLEHIFHQLNGGLTYLNIMFELIDSGRWHVAKSSADLLRSAYQIAGRRRETVYDCVFVALALKLGVELLTHDNKQMRTLQRERAAGS